MLPWSPAPSGLGDRGASLLATMSRTLSRTVWILSLISLFTDMASEMLYPVMPIYLKSIGFSIVLIGVLEGVAEATAGLSKGYFGMRSDRLGRRAPFVQWGYALSAISKPMMAVFIAPLWIFFARTIDRLGKGIRTGARDALLNDETTPATKGRVFGFHRSMDTMGAVLGPSLALVYLYFHPGDYVPLFFIAFAPGVLAIALSFLLKESRNTVLEPTRQFSFFAFLRYWKESPSAYRKLTTGLLLFALFNSSDVFLLLQAKNAGLSDTGTIGVYIFYNLVYRHRLLPAWCASRPHRVEARVPCRVSALRCGILRYGHGARAGNDRDTVLRVWTVCSGHRRHREGVDRQHRAAHGDGHGHRHLRRFPKHLCVGSQFASPDCCGTASGLRSRFWSPRWSPCS